MSDEVMMAAEIKTARVERDRAAERREAERQVIDDARVVAESFSHLSSPAIHRLLKSLAALDAVGGQK